MVYWGIILLDFSVFCVLAFILVDIHLKGKLKKVAILGIVCLFIVGCTYIVQQGKQAFITEIAQQSHVS